MFNFNLWGALIILLMSEWFTVFEFQDTNNINQNPKECASQTNCKHEGTETLCVFTHGYYYILWRYTVAAILITNGIKVHVSLHFGLGQCSSWYWPCKQERALLQELS